MERLKRITRRRKRNATVYVDKRTGHVYERFYSSTGRPAHKSPCDTVDAAREHATKLQALVDRLHAAGFTKEGDDAIAKGAELVNLATLARAVDVIVKRGSRRIVPAGTVTFEAFARTWMSGELADTYPDYVRRRTPHAAKSDLGRLENWVFPHVGTIPIKEFTRADYDLVLSKLGPKLAPETRRKIAKLVVRTLKLAVHPARLRESSPIPAGAIPLSGKPKALQYLFPREEAQLLGCTKIGVARRMLYGFLSREGWRCSDAWSLRWTQVDLALGCATLPDSKSGTPRPVALDPGVTRALKLWKPRCPSKKYVFASKPGRPLEMGHSAERLRDHLRRAGVNRAELYLADEKHIRVRLHDLRAGFVTTSLANGKPEWWIRDRTGHTTTEMMDRYRRLARTFAELHVGDFTPLDQAIPELTRDENGGPSGPGGGTVDGETGDENPQADPGRHGNSRVDAASQKLPRVRSSRGYHTLRSALIRTKSSPEPKVRGSNPLWRAEAEGASSPSRLPDSLPDSGSLGALLATLGEALKTAIAAGQWQAVEAIAANIAGITEELRARRNAEAGPEPDDDPDVRRR